ncbi:MAG: ankyrin repeat domain-containing protein [bacterium]
MKRQILIIFAIIILLNTAALSQDIFNAVKNNDLSKLKDIVENDLTKINSEDENERTPLHWAARGVYYEIMRYLVAKGADVNARDNNNITALISVVSRNNLEAATLLLDNGAKIQEEDNLRKAPIFYAIGSESQKMMELLIKRGAYLEPVNNYKRTPLLMTCRETGALQIVKLLVESGANINAKDIFGDTPLTLTAWRGFEDIVNYLLDNNAEFTTEGNEGIKLLSFAVDKRLWKLYNQMIDKGGDAFLKILYELPVLYLAASGGSIEIVNDLISRKIPVNGIDEYGWTPLHYASYFGRAEVVKLLIAKGADVNPKTPLGESPLYLARSEIKTDVADILLTAGSDLHFPGSTNLSGKYFGQKLTSDSLELFAPGIASRLKGGHSNIAFSPEGNEAVWTEWYLNDVGYADGCKIWHSKIENGFWSIPRIIVAKGDTPFYSVDGERLYFVTVRPVPPTNDSAKAIWYFEKSDTSFSIPKYLNFDLADNGLYWQFSFDKNNDIYFSGDGGFFRSINKNGEYMQKESLDEVLHPDIKGMGPFISPDESYIIFSSMDYPDSFGSMDLYISFKKSDGKWSKPINMGPKINSPEQELLPMVSNDGKYLFLRAKRNNVAGIYWINANIIGELKSNLQD